MKTAFLVDDNVVHGESPLSCVHSANSERGHLLTPTDMGKISGRDLMTLEKRDGRGWLVADHFSPFPG
jgi:hypothetical protein